MQVWSMTAPAHFFMEHVFADAVCPFLSLPGGSGEVSGIRGCFREKI